MTLASSIITDAYRETNLTPMAGAPSTTQVTEGLARLNNIILSSLGYEINDELRDLNYGGDYDQSNYVSTWVPDNTRIVFNLTVAATVTLSPQPYDGQRFAIVDASGNFATYNLTIDANGRSIEAADTVTISTNDTVKQWMYRADTGNWVVLTSLLSSEELPFPEEFDDYFILMLALRLSPRYGQSLRPESVTRLTKMASKLRSRYRRKDYDLITDPGLLGPEQTYWTTGLDAFNRGRPWSWPI